MIVKIIPIILILFIGEIRVQDKNNILVWNKDIKLEWNDFKGETPDSVISYTVALAFIEIIYTEIENFPYYHVLSTFNRCNSWSRTSSSDVLSHEQLHFDISEIYVRKMRKSFFELQDSDASKYQLYDIIIDLSHQCMKYNDLYDSETANGIYKIKQEQWNLRIAKELDELNKFEVISHENNNF